MSRRLPLAIHAFHLGTPVLALAFLGAVTGLVVLARPSRRRADLNFWLYAEPHADAYRPLLPLFRRQSGLTVGIDLIPQQALNTRLVSLFMSGRTQGEVPDVVELEVADVGKYFRPPPEAVGLLPLNDYLRNTGFREIPDPGAPGRDGENARCKADGKIYTYRGGRWLLNPGRSRPDAWIDRLLLGRLALWTKGGVIFGVPHDVHPVTLSYRKDLWDEAGIDPEWVRGGDGQPRRPTWGQFQEKCLAFQAYWSARGVRTRHALELLESKPDMLVCLLLQRHVNVIDADETLHLTDPKTAQTLALYAQLVAGPRRVAAESAGGTGPWANDVAEGNLCAFLTPDWRVAPLRGGAGAVAGKLRMMPLPRFDPDDAPTSTWGGTMIGIPRASRHPEEAWKLIQLLYLSDAGLEERVREAGLPPVKDDWDKPFLHQPDPFFGGQKTDELYIELADQVPASYETWASVLARGGLGYVLNEATAYIRKHGTAEGLEQYVTAELRRADAYVRRAIEHGTFEGRGGE